MTDSAASSSERHPHEPQVPPALDAEGRCLVCGLALALEDLLAVAERIRGGDRSLDPEEWYLVRDHARVVLGRLA